MSRTVRADLVQTSWTGDRTRMIAHQIELLHQAAAQGAQVACLQEVFNAPYFCQVQDSAYYSLAEAVPAGETVQQMQQVAAALNLVLVVPLYEQESPGVYYNTAAVIDADG